jgi:Thylakoid formation protein
LLVLQVFALGFISVIDQILEGFPGAGKEEILQAYLQALQEDDKGYRR